MARLVESSVVDGHFHHYTDKVSAGRTTTETSIVNGHSHVVTRDGAGGALSIEPSADGHTHDLGDLHRIPL